MVDQIAVKAGVATGPPLRDRRSDVARADDLRYADPFDKLRAGAAASLQQLLNKPTAFGRWRAARGITFAIA